VSRDSVFFFPSVLSCSVLFCSSLFRSDKLEIVFHKDDTVIIIGQNVDRRRLNLSFPTSYFSF
jgi:hypothetical protein